MDKHKEILIVYKKTLLKHISRDGKMADAALKYLLLLLNIELNIESEECSCQQQ